MNSMRDLIKIVENGPEVTVIDRPPVKKKQSQDVPVHLPGGFTVVVLNDPVTPFEVAVEAVVAGTHLSPGEAIKRMMAAHKKGYAPVAAYATKDMAETVAENIEQHARANKSWDHLRPYVPYMGKTGYTGPWPLSCEVMES